MTYAEFFEKIRDKYMNVDVSDIKEHLAYQFNIIGEAEGIYYVEVKDGKLYVEPYVQRALHFLSKRCSFLSRELLNVKRAEILYSCINVRTSSGL